MFIISMIVPVRGGGRLDLWEYRVSAAPWPWTTRTEGLVTASSP